MSETKLDWRAIAEPTANAFKTYWKAILLIQCFALAVVISYYQLDGAAGFFAGIADWKRDGGLAFSAAFTVLSGGLIPEAVKRILRPASAKGPSAAEFIHQLIFWALIGMLIDLFYQLQAVIFGHGTGAGTLLCKVLFDQLVFTPLISQPFTAIWFMIWESGYNKSRFAETFSLPTLVRRALQLWTVCLCFWPVMLLIVYSLPQVLQFPLFLFGNAAYSILMIFIVRRQNDD